MKKAGLKLAVGLLICGMAESLIGCMPNRKQEAETVQTEADQTEADQTAADQTEADSGDEANAIGTSKAAQAATDMEVHTADPIMLRMNWWGGDDRHKATLDAIEAFEKKYPNITVKAEYESFAGHEEKVALALKSGSAADVIQLNMDWVFNYSPEGTMFVDLNTVSTIFDLTAYDQSDIRFFTTKGALQAIPVSNTGRVFFWNKTMFDKTGTEIPKTLDELYAAGEKFAAYEDGSYYPLVLKELDRMTLMAYYLQCKYGKPWVENYEPQYAKEEIEEGLDFLEVLEEMHVIPTLETLAGDGAELIDIDQKWIDGHYAGIYMWDSNLLKHKEAARGFDFTVGDFIKMGDYHGGMKKASCVFAIPKASNHPAEAAALMQFMLGEREGAEALQDTRGVPANKNAQKYLDLSSSMVWEANEKMKDWTQFEFDPIFERAQLKNADGTYFLTQQLLSYKQADVEKIAQMLMDSIHEQLALAKQQ